ncbi:MAG: PQQ-dependent sugar dehydrogenase [Deltaproteobacteria bacterium]|nr:PQQ-dependent sugar dehydrogenase [Deltaproteobacteria bacterium]
MLLRGGKKWLLLLLILPAGAIAAWLLGLAPVLPSPSWGNGLPLDKIKLPSGFAIQVHAQVPGARSLVLGPQGTLIVGTRGDKVFAVKQGGLGRAGEVVTLAQGLRQPNGVAMKGGDLYIAAVDKVYKLPDIEDNLDNPPAPRLISDKLPGDDHHGWRYAAFGPDGLLYIAVGAPCNVCEAPDPYSTIIRMQTNGSYEVFARGIRNSVGMDWRPSNKVLWFTNNGRDWMGDDEPPDSLHRAPETGLNFGFPYCHAGVPDPELNQGKGCARFAPAARKLPAHVAALGMRFYTGDMFPPSYRGAIFIAEHGSWNRSKPIGYRVSLVQLQGEKAVDYQQFATGWLEEISAWGRPVDVLVDRTGALLVSDDRAGVIYRITYEKP